MDIGSRYLAVFFSCILLAGCGGGGSSLPASTQNVVATRTAKSNDGPVPPVLHTFDPALADTSITAFRSPTYAYTPISPTNGSLLVFLPGQQAVPGVYTTFGQFAAATAGYHVLNLDYPNQTAPSEICNNDPTCDGNVLLQKWNGTPGNDHVTPGNSIENRITKELEYLDATYPTEGWNQFLVSGEVQWWNVTFAGHSLGSWEVGYIATILQVKRAIMFAGPEDADVANGAPIASDWLSTYSRTPAYKKFIFVHVQDPNYPVVQIDVTAMGLDTLGPWTSVDGASIPFGGSHELTTDVPSSDPHHAVVFDGAIPLDANGNPVFANAWKDILTPQPGQQ